MVMGYEVWLEHKPVGLRLYTLVEFNAVLYPIVSSRSIYHWDSSDSDVLL